MPDSEQTMVTYLDLACASQRRQRLSETDKLTVLAAAAAMRLGFQEVAEACREQVLAHNPRHLLRRWPSIEAALATERFQAYLKHVQRQYPPERAEYMLGCLGERPVFTGSSAPEMATALLGKLARQRMAAEQAPKAGPAGADGRPVVRGTKRRIIRASSQAVAKRLRGTKRNQEFLWWPYWAGVAVLAVLAVAWAVRRHG